MMKKRGIKRVMIITGAIIAVVAGLIVLFFQLPYSVTKSEFERGADEAIKQTAVFEGTFTADDFKGLPQPMKTYMEQSGFFGKPKMSYMKAVFHNIDFLMDKKKPPIKINYTQYNFVQEPRRLAFIDTWMYGIPFQGLDSFVEGKGGMKGVLAKSIKLFNQTGPEMDQACLVTFLAEAVLLPTALLQDYIRWEPIDGNRVKAVIEYKDLSAGGIFTFDEAGELKSFVTEDRFMVNFDGKSEQVPWTVKFENYEIINGIKQPTRLQATWNEKAGDTIYFDNDGVDVTYDKK